MSSVGARLALAQVNPTVGDLEANAGIVLRESARAHDLGADIVAFPEMMLTGYPVEDLALRPSFQQASETAVHDLAVRLSDAGLGDLTVVVGFLEAAPATPGGDDGRPRGANAAAVMFDGSVLAIYRKHHLPNYGVFDERRYFVSGTGSVVVRVAGTDVALAICEDLWQDGGPVSDAAARQPDVLLVLNGSPYERGKAGARMDLCRRRAAEAGCPLAYVNLVGGQDELVFDGGSLVVAADGSLLGRAAHFTDDLLVVDIPPRREPHLDDRHPPTVVVASPARHRPPRTDGGDPLPPSDVEGVYRALELGLGDYVRKNGFASVALGLSGGIDSALVAALACDALGAENVSGVSMPSEYSSHHSIEDAVELAERTGLHLRTVRIQPLVAAVQAVLPLDGVAAENLQARLRGMVLMSLSNQEGHLVLATGNKSEIAVGYSTIYGDAVGGFAPIKDVPKSLVWQLARWRNDHAEARGETPPIPERSISKPPSAELRPDQLDTDSLPDYSLLDAVLDAYVEHDRGADQLVASGFDIDLVDRIVRLIDAAEYKRRQYPPGTKITFRAFGRDRRLPITNRWRERP